MDSAVKPPEAPGRSGGGSRLDAADSSRLHQVLRISIALTLAAGLFHLLNLVGSGRGGFGPALITPFRFTFAVSWLLLITGWMLEWRRLRTGGSGSHPGGSALPRIDRTDALIAGFVAVFLLRGALTPETFSITLNWAVTGAGMFFLVRFGTRSAADVRFMLLALVGSSLVLAIYGLGEYALKANPLFDSIQVEAIGIDKRIAASDQFYRIRTLVGHPGFAGAILLGAMPLTFLVFWRRRLLLAASLVCLSAGIFLSFSRGSWLIAVLVLFPVALIWSRSWVRRNLKWLVPAALIPAAIIAFDYFSREEVSANLGEVIREKGLHWTLGKDGPIRLTSGESYGVQPYNKFVYFDVADDFHRGGDDGPVTIVVHFFDRGMGALRIEYDSMTEGSGGGQGANKPTPSINKTNSHTWSTVAFYIRDPRFEGRLNYGADFRVVDDDSLMTLDEVVVQKGRLKLPGVVAQQWSSRAASMNTRAEFLPLTRDVLAEDPLGVGLFNTPGTEHHAVDSLPLTWMMEFGWPGLLLILGLVALIVRECWFAWKQPREPAVVLLLSLVLILLHGGHLMILYDKPSLVLAAGVAALYADIRPWRRGGAAIRVSNQDCMV
ncbi:MAG: hypothetical protein HZB44_09460 [Actinobacteria bacterium]|nr:hypothetical protein [Actinomycetota bacterium]